MRMKTDDLQSGRIILQCATAVAALFSIGIPCAARADDGSWTAARTVGDRYPLIYRCEGSEHQHVTRDGAEPVDKEQTFSRVLAIGPSKIAFFDMKGHKWSFADDLNVNNSGIHKVSVQYGWDDNDDILGDNWQVDATVIIDIALPSGDFTMRLVERAEDNPNHTGDLPSIGGSKSYARDNLTVEKTRTGMCIRISDPIDATPPAAKYTPQTTSSQTSNVDDVVEILRSLGFGRNASGHYELQDRHEGDYRIQVMLCGTTPNCFAGLQITTGYCLLGDADNSSKVQAWLRRNPDVTWENDAQIQADDQCATWIRVVPATGVKRTAIMNFLNEAKTRAAEFSALMD